MSFKQIFSTFLLVFFFINYAAAQRFNASLYEQTSEMGSLMISYKKDVDAINDFYNPYSTGNYYDYPIRTISSPEQFSRLLDINNSYLDQLKAVDFESFSIYGKIDYVLLKKEIEAAVYQISKDKEDLGKLDKYFPFARQVYALEKSRKRGTFQEGPFVAGELNRIKKQVDSLAGSLKKSNHLKADQLKLANELIFSFKARLQSYYQFYNTYEPGFSWWVPKPYERLTESLTDYGNMFTAKNDSIEVVRTIPKGGKTDIKGSAIGRKELLRQLQDELIPYSPEELIGLAEKEFKYCDKELLKASAEMGFGKDWKKAQEKIKNSFVPLGKQAELIIKLQNDASEFIKANNLINIPPLAEETWGMVMMSAERQLVNPFFTGGREISISYPTSSMDEEDKLMSMRGNNPYFSRGTVQHELLPGHHLQYFMNSRYKSYRGMFRTPFSVEGWPLYWELLLYEKGFARTPEEKIGMLFWRMHRCARILFSLNFHLGRWTPQECVDFLVDRVGHERANAEGEVRRSFKGDYSPLYQVAYLTGGLQLYALKKELVDSGKMTYIQFHDTVMKENLIPVEMIRATLINQPITRDFKTSWKFYEQLK